MPATSIQAISNKKLARKTRRQLERESQIKDLGGVSISIPLCRPLRKTESLERSRYLRKLKNIKYETSPNKLAKNLTIERYKKKMIDGARNRGTKLSIPLKPEDIEIPEFCPVLGLPLVIGSLDREFSPSLDKVVPSKGYVKGNVCVISNRANRLKSDASLEELEKLVEYVKRFTSKTTE